MKNSTIKKTPIILLILILSFASFAQGVSVIEVNETDLVNLKIDAIDPDGDELYYTYDLPLNSSGQWQTTYGDYGEWAVNITVSDGQVNTVKPVLIRVYKVNWPPVLEEMDDIIVNEGETVKVRPEAEDEEGDTIDYSISEPVGDDGEWETDFEDAGEYEITVTATDNKHDPVSESFTLTVKDVNRDPSISEYVPEDGEVKIKEGEEQMFAISASDPDKDDLEYTWNLDGEDAAKSSTYTYSPDYESAGRHVLKGSVSDGSVIIGVSWDIEVTDVNRPPKLSSMEDMMVDEGDLVKLEFKAKDPDKDEVRYTVSEPIGDDKEWQTDFEDAGTYNIQVTISDGEYFDSDNLTLVVRDVDRAPEFREIEDITITEEQKVELKLKAADPDGDEVWFSAENIPEGAAFEEDTFKFTPNYRTVYKPKNWFTSMLKFLHLDDIFYSDKVVFPVRFTAYGKDKSSEQTVKIIVEDVNRAPVLLEMDDISVYEGETVTINPKAVEYDNDRVIFTISDPVGNDGRWKTGFEDAGSYTLNVTASDRYLSDSTSVNIEVKNSNRAPTLQEIEPVEINEGEEVKFDLIASDPDGDDIEISAEKMPEGASFGKDGFSWTPGYDIVDYRLGKQGYEITFTASDRELNDSKTALITVHDVNQPPEFVNVTPNATVTVYKGQAKIFSADAVDQDNDTLSYDWNFGLLDKLEDSTSAISRKFWKPGTKEIEVVVSDGNSEIMHTWTVTVIEKKVEKATEPEKTEQVQEKTQIKPESSKKGKTYTLTVV